MKYLFLAVLFFTSPVFASDCFFTHSIRNFQVYSPTEIRLLAGRDNYQLQVSYCSELPWAHRIAFDTFGGSRVCRGDRILVLDNFSNRVVQSCHIFDIHKF